MKFPDEICCKVGPKVSISFAMYAPITVAFGIDRWFNNLVQENGEKSRVLNTSLPTVMPNADSMLLLPYCNI